jgi:hypothetical protein
MWLLLLRFLCCHRLVQELCDCGTLASIASNYW